MEEEKARPAAPEASAARMACAFMLSLAAACVGKMAPALASLALGFLLCLLFRPALPILLKRLAAANLFIALIWLTASWATPGEAIFNLGHLRVTREGVALCLLVTVKANAVLLIFLALASGLGMQGLGAALLSLHCPNKLALMIMLMDRNVDILRAQWRKLTEAAELRGHAPAGTLKSCRVLAALLALLIVRASDRAEICHEAMLLRGFDGTLRLGGPISWTGRNIAACGAGACVALALILWDAWL